MNIYMIDMNVYFKLRSDLHGEDSQHDDVISNLFLNGDSSICIRIVIGKGYG